MELRKLTSLGTYEEINSGAHRKAAQVVGVPSLVRHLGFWSIAAGGREDAYRAYVERLEAAIKDPRRTALNGDQISTVSGLNSRIDTGTVTLVRFWWHKMRANIRLEFHTEYITLTSILDLSVKTLDDADAPDGQPQADLWSALDQFKELFETCQPAADPRYGEVSEALQIEVWERFEEEVLNLKAKGTNILGDTLGEVFLDSRGIVTGSMIDKTSDKPLPAGLRERQSVRDRCQYALPRNRARTTIEHGFPGAAWARETLHRLWPFIESEPYFGEFEFTVTGFLQGRVLFITSLGPQVSAPGRGKQKWTPIRYFLHAFTDEEWQLGRLVDRINTLGTLRLAATMEIEGLKSAGGAMEELAAEIERALAHVQRAIKNVGEEPPTSMQAAEGRMGRVAKLYKKINDTVSGDISHRLERSLYYVQRFGKEAIGLRERRVEGYQTYSEFVTRRMNSIFGYISFLRTRLESIDSLNSNLTRQYSSLKITDVTLGIDRLVHVLNDQNSNIATQNETIAGQEKEIGKIQEFGEIALIGALVPYYVSTSISNILAPRGLLNEAVWIVITAICSIAVMARIWSKGKNPDVWRRLKEVFWLFLAYLLLLAVAFAAMRQPWNAVAWKGSLSASTQDSQGTSAPGH